MASNQTALVIGELTDTGSLDSITGELLAAASRVADSIECLLLGAGATEAGQQAIQLGATKVHASEDALLTNINVDAMVEAAHQAASQINPTIVLVGKTLVGRDLAPRLAFRFDVPLVQDCIDIAVDGEQVVATRPVYGGNALAKIACSKTPQVLTMRPKTFDPLPADASKSGEVVQISLNIDASVQRVSQVERITEEQEGEKLEEAKIVVAVGRGIADPANLPAFESLAKTMGAALGASRAVVDAGWLDHSYQVGLTGKSIAPELYLTWAISGASQHMAGCTNAKNIVAINKDPECNIFKESRFGVVGDWEKVLPGFAAMLSEMGVA
ncbi:MAG: electron transfer flavoprotein subunit alpha [Chloroflexi bacterium]|nr:electron transfer flavoprotein subunit alpha [Chloroflexota bacterium]|tara:strand:+ start:1129 stop:2112 length:984 start_codon:yes stop_codon:yes gene_type:complete